MKGINSKGIKTLLALAILLPWCAKTLAHEVPSSVIVQTIVKVDGNRLEVLVRAPLEAMRDVTFPLTGPGYVVISEADQHLRDAAQVWIAQEMSVFANDQPLVDWSIDTVRLALPSSRAFESYDAAIAEIRRPRLADSEQLHRDQALLDVLISYPLTEADAEISLVPNFARLGLNTTTVVRYLHTDGAERLYRFAGDPGLLRLDPSWHHSFFRFVTEGIVHIWEGPDHLLFVLCLLIPFRRIRPLIVIITSFTIAHSITLMAAAFGMVPNFLWFPPMIETLIAASIVYMAFENIVGSHWEKRWFIAFAFGLVHGFGFSFALSESLQFAGAHLVTSLLAFNLGVEIGQLILIVIAVPLINVLFRHVVTERMGTIILSALLAHNGWHWMTERGAELTAYSYTLPTFDWAFFATAIRWLMLATLIGGILWLMTIAVNRFSGEKTATEL